MKRARPLLILLAISLLAMGSAASFNFAVGRVVAPSAEDLAAHFETPHMAEWRRALAEGVTIRGRDLHRYEVSGTEPL